MKNSTKIILIVISAIILCGSIFILGRKSVKITEKIVTNYEKGDTIHLPSKIPDPLIIKENADTLGILTYCIHHGLCKSISDNDTVSVYVIDTAKVFKDWSSKIVYSQELFNIDTVGVCKIETYTQYNRLGEINTTFIPVTKTIEIQREIKPKIEPFIGVGLFTNSSVSGQVGLFTGNGWGFSGQYQYSITMNNHSFSVFVLKKF